MIPRQYTGTDIEEKTDGCLRGTWNNINTNTLLTTRLLLGLLQRKKATSKKSESTTYLQAKPPLKCLEIYGEVIRRDFIDFVDVKSEQTKHERKNVYSLEIFPSDMIETFGQWPMESETERRWRESLLQVILIIIIIIILYTIS